MSTAHTSTPSPSTSETSAAAAPVGGPASSHGAPTGPAIQRQFVNFAFYKLDPAFRRLPAEQKEQARAQFAALLAQRNEGMICLTYSLVGVKADSDFLLWRIALSPDKFATQSAAINRSILGGYLSQPESFLSMTKRSMYIDQLDPFHTAESRTHIIPGKRKYLFIYPFVKTREWYLMPMDKRQEIMDEHIKVGNKYPMVKLNTTYSFGLDDQDFVVAFESDSASDFLDLVQELRETRSSLYTVRDTPMYTCTQASPSELLSHLF